MSYVLMLLVALTFAFTFTLAEDQFRRNKSEQSNSVDVEPLLLKGGLWPHLRTLVDA